MGKRHPWSGRRDDDERYTGANPQDAWDGDDAWESESQLDRALATRNSGGALETLPSDTGPVIIAGDGVSMGNPFIKRRERPLTMRITAMSLMAAIIVTGIFAITPMGATGASQVTAFQALAGSLVLQKGPTYFLYTTQPGDDAEALAQQFHVQIGGIYQLNGLLLGQELAIGTAYKIPNDPNYGANYRPPTFVVTSSAGGGNVYGSNWWNSVSGTPDLESPCAPDGHGSPLGYKLHSPNWGSHWVRGFSWYHNGDDLAAQNGNTIHAAQSGQVIWANYDATNGLGWSVKINNCNHISTLYGHMQKLLVKTGAYVLMGDPIGLEGSTGWSTGPHLHFMVEWDNNPVDPFPYFTGIPAMTNYVS